MVNMNGVQKAELSTGRTTIRQVGMLMAGCGMPVERTNSKERESRDILVY